MKRILIITVLTCSNFLIAFSQKNKSSFKKAMWAGTLKRDVIITHTNDLYSGTVEQHVEIAFAAALPTMYREDENEVVDRILNDKGTGKHTLHGVLTNNFTKQKCITDCSGMGEASLHSVIIREWDNTYDIEAIAPICVGTTCDGQGGTKEYEEEFMITISNEKFTDKDVLAGSKTVTGELPGGLGTITTTTTWSLRKEKENNDVELIVTLVDYDTWLPEAGINELIKGNVLRINLELRGKNGKPLKVKAESFELYLTNTSMEPGITINYPLIPDKKQLPDLRFIQRPDIESVQEDQFITAESSNGITGKAFLASYDGGGWTMLKVEAILNDNNKTRVPGQLLISGGESEILIPKRDPKSKIGEAWMKKYKNPGETDDNDYSSGNNNDGDGLSAYEEYRGVISEAEFGKTNRNNFGRLDPNKKDLGVKVKRNERTLFEDGMKLLEKAAYINVICFTEREIGQDRRLNKNQGSFNIYEQYTEQLENGALSGDALGENQPANVIAKTPAKSEHVIIDINKIKNSYANQLATVQNAINSGSTNKPIPYTEAEEIANTVAHELAHGINVNHHGTPSDESDKTIPLTSVDIYHVFDEMSGEITEQFRGKTISGIGKPHNDESGDLSCIMAYTNLYNWVLRIGTDGSLNYYKVKLLPVGKNMCTKKVGNGINYNNQYFGDAATDFGNYVFGNCLSQIKLKD